MTWLGDLGLDASSRTRPAVRVLGTLFLVRCQLPLSAPPTPPAHEEQTQSRPGFPALPEDHLLSQCAPALSPTGTRMCVDPGPPQKGPSQIVDSSHSPQSFLPIHLQPGLVLLSSLAMVTGSCLLFTSVFIRLMNPPSPPPPHTLYLPYRSYIL